MADRTSLEKKTAAPEDPAAVEEASAAEEAAAAQKCGACVRYKATPRDAAEKKRLVHRLNRLSGQISGIRRMIEEDRYCGDVLTQIAAAESALQNVGYLVLRSHMETCVVEAVRSGDTQIVDEAVDLMKKLK
ncbi:MAG: metal-sensing transcriptional repressor [Anaerovoracaceae bacterium]|jgi:DNA-binding FrmR family transcriptional regulator